MDVSKVIPGNGLSVDDLLENLPVGIYTCDTEGLITYFNPRARDLWGRAPKLRDPEDRFCGSFKLYLPDGKAILHQECWMALALRDASPYHGREIIIERPDGNRVTALAHASPLRNHQGEVVGAINALMDITDHQVAQQAQTEMRATLAHIGRLSLAGEMATGVAHELNQPLTAIINYSEACINLLRSGGDTRYVIDLLTHMVDQGRWAGEIIQRLRGFTRKAPVQRQPVDINALVRDSIDFIAGEAQRARVTLRVETADGLQMPEADPVQLQQVLLNLLRNSLDAMGECPSDSHELLVQTSMADNGAVQVSVTDTGPGVSEHLRDRLFHPFITTKPQGMGLGLSISKSIINAQGGELSADTQRRHGASFRFALPCP
ncbi:MAG: PAS domain S-box protein [Ectothiorhodospiraceae bacterium]|nr:PAS domain S-box protein [Ectothiorhodospiraceae bacterium]